MRAGRVGGSIAGVVALVGASLASLVLLAGPAAATDVLNETQFRNAFANTAETLISLTSDIHLTSPGCTAAGRSNGSALTIEGNGYTITQDCANTDGLLAGTGGLTFNNVTLSGGRNPVSADASVVLNNSNISGVADTGASAYGIQSSHDVTLTGSTITGVSAKVTANGISAAGNVTLDTSMIANLNGLANGADIAGIGCGGNVSLTGSTLTGFTSGNDASVDVISCSGTVTLAGSTISSMTGPGANSNVYVVQNGSGPDTITDTQITDVTASAYVYVVSTGATVNVTRSNILRTSATNATGYVYVFTNGGALTLTDSTITDTSAGAYVYVASNSSDLTLVRSTIARTTATAAGGYVYIATNGGKATLTDSSVTDTMAGAGGYVYVFSTSSDVVLTRSKVLNTEAPGAGGYVYVVTNGSIVTLTDSVIDSTKAGSGVGGYVYVISASDAVTLNNSRITNTEGGENGYAYVITNGEDVVLTNSSIVGVSVTGGSGYIYGISSGGAVTMVNSTIANLQAPAYVFVIQVSGNVALTNSTITGNAGSAISNGGTVTLVYSDIVGNGTASAVPVEVQSKVGVQSVAAQVQSDGALTMFGSVITAPVGGFLNCQTGPKTSKGYNFSDDTTCALTAVGDRQGAGLAPLLLPLADNGGPTPTLLPQLASPLVDAIPTAACQTAPATGITTDQRLLPRPQFGGCDIGSVELQPAPPVVVQPSFTG